MKRPWIPAITTKHSNLYKPEELKRTRKKDTQTDKEVENANAYRDEIRNRRDETNGQSRN